jgi:hypothetical protein
MRWIAAAALMALAACKPNGSAPSGPSEAAADVLSGSASDAMIPYDTLRSQPPLAPTAPDALRAGAGGAEGAEGANAAPSDAPSAAAAPQPPTVAPSAAPY